MKSRAYLLLLILLPALACNAPGREQPTVTVPGPTTLTQTPPEATQPISPTPATVTRTPVPTVATLSPPTPIPTAPSLPPLPSDYVVDREATIGSHLVQVWRPSSPDSPSFEQITTISLNGQMLAQVGSSAEVDLSGRDVTGEGNPDLVIQTFSGGAHCCFSTVIYDLGATLRKVLETRPSNCGGTLEDLDGDGSMEVVICDDLFAYTYCPFASSPMPRVILKYRAGAGYVPASPDFAALYAEDITMHREWAQQAVPGGYGEWDQTVKCAVLPLVLDYLYIGQATQAWDALVQYYPHPDRLLLWAEVLRAVRSSSLYVQAGEFPNVPLPPYYMLQLLTSCGPDQQFIGFLREGQNPCAPDVPRREVFWLEAELAHIGLLDAGERLQLAPEGCTSNCRLDIVRATDEVRVGSIRLDTTVGFPGAVYRSNGLESTRWRLRGDLVWEQIRP